MKGVAMNRRSMLFSLLLFVLMFSLCFSQKTPQDGAIQVNSTWITQSSIDNVINSYQQQIERSNPNQATNPITPEMKKTVAMQLIANELLKQEAAKRKIPVNQIKLDSLYNNFMAQYPDSTALIRQLAAVGQTTKSIRDDLRSSLMIESLVKTLFKPSDTIDDSACKAYYDTNPQFFIKPGRYRVSQIMLKTTSAMTSSAKKALQEKADTILAALRGGKSFEVAAKQYSQDPGAITSGGDIGWFSPGDIRPEFDSAVVRLKINDISPVFETDLGFHIIKKTDEEPGTTTAYEDVQNQIKYILMQHKRDEVLRVFLNKLKSAAKITYKNQAYAQ
jgi:parvulin-like peptidyl-prolyl isomerase